MTKKLTILFLFLSALAFGQGIDEKTQSIIKVKYMAAQKAYGLGQYYTTLSKVSEIETLLNGQKNPTVQNLKVKALIGDGQYQKAKKELDVLYGLKPSAKISADIASYEGKIDAGIKAEKAAAESARLAAIEKEKADAKAEENARKGELYKRDVLEDVNKQYSAFVAKYGIDNGTFIYNKNSRADIDKKYGREYFKRSDSLGFYTINTDWWEGVIPVGKTRGDNGASTNVYPGHHIKYFGKGYFVIYQYNEKLKKDYYQLFNTLTKKAFFSCDSIEFLFDGTLIKTIHKSYYYDKLNKTYERDRDGNLIITSAYIKLWDRQGNWIHRNIDYMSSFSEGLAVIRFINEKSGYIDSEGNILVRDRFYIAKTFSEGLAVVSYRYPKNRTGYNSKCGFINKDFALVISDKYEECEACKDGKVRVKKKSGGKWITLDKNGEKVK